MPLAWHGRVDQPETLREVGRQRHAAADRLAVQPGAVAGAGLDRVAEGMAEVEDRAQPRFLLVAGDDAAFSCTSGYRLHERGVVARQQIVEVRFEPAEEVRVGDRAVLDDFGQSGDQLALRQSRRASRDRRRPATAGGRRRPGSCPADG